MAYQSEWGAAVGDISREHDWITPLLLRYEGPLLRYAQRLTNCPDRARDVVQETFLRLCREPAVAREAHVAQWLFTVCRNYAIDLKRKEQRMTPAASAELGNSPSPAPTPDAQAEQNETADRILSPGRRPAGEPANGADAEVPRCAQLQRHRRRHGPVGLQRRLFDSPGFDDIKAASQE